MSNGQGGYLLPEEYEQEIRELKAMIKDLELRAQNLPGDGVEVLRKKLDEKIVELAGVKSELERKNKDFAQVKGELEKTKKELTEVKAELEKWEKMPDNSKAVLAIRDKKIKDLETRLAEAQAKSKTENAPANESELADTQAKLDAKCIEIKNLTKDKTDLIQQTNDLTKKCNDLIKKVNLLEAEQTQDLGYNIIIWGHIWKGLAVLLDVIVIWLFAYCSSGFITTATIMLVVFLTLANLLILAMRILHCISEFTPARFDTITLLANIFGSICLLAVFILIILVFGVGL